MTWAIRGLIEGFYGTPWTWDQRVDVLSRCAQQGMTHYVYAPKDDPKHRERWREPYGTRKLAGFARLVEETGLSIGFGISPGLSIDAHDDDDLGALVRKVDQAVSVGMPLVVLCLDDLPVREGLAEEHLLITRHLREHLGERAELVLVPTEYTGVEPTPYLQALAEGLPEDVLIGWTGLAVVNDQITADHARMRAQALGGRKPFLWDNFPVNDSLMGDRLHLGPLWGRDAELAEECSGYLANPMIQPHASELPLASVAGFLRGEDPIAAWAAAAGELQVFAEACDGSVPQVLVQQLAARIDQPDWVEPATDLGQWLQAARICLAPGLTGEVDPWLEQVHHEASLGLHALRLILATRPVLDITARGRGRLRAPDPAEAEAEAFTLAGRWPLVRRSPVAVMGVRLGFRPVMGQARDGRWTFDRSCIVEDTNAMDALVRLAFDCLAALPDDLTVALTIDDEPVKVRADGTFRVPSPAATVEARCGAVLTRATGPTIAPLADS